MGWGVDSEERKGEAACMAPSLPLEIVRVEQQHARCLLATGTLGYFNERESKWIACIYNVRLRLLFDGVINGYPNHCGTG